jgi:hypothetical protein
MLEVTKAEHAGDYSINLQFNNGKAGIADLKATIFGDHRGIFSTLKNPARFQNFKVEHSTVTWSDELDLAAEYLFYLAFCHDPDLQDQFKSWGYLGSSQNSEKSAR